MYPSAASTSALWARPWRAGHWTTTPATKIFLTDPFVRLLMVSRVLVSWHFAVHMTGQSGQSAGISIDALRGVLGEAHASVSWKRESAQTVAFKGTWR